MVSSDQKVACRPDMPQTRYRPGHGLKNRGLKSGDATIADESSGSDNISNRSNSPSCEISSNCVRKKFNGVLNTVEYPKNDKIRRPDIQIYQPKAKLNALRFNEEEQSTLMTDSSSRWKEVKRATLGSNLENTSYKQIDPSSCVNVVDNSFTKIRSDLSEPVKSKRPDIQVYVPKAKLYASRVNEKLCSSVEGCSSKIEEKNELQLQVGSHISYNSSGVKLLTRHVDTESVENREKWSAGVLDSSTLKSKSWADQVEEELSTASHSTRKESCTFSTDVDKLEQQNDLVKSIGHAEVDSLSEADVLFAGVLDASTLNSKSWADQVEEQLSAASHSNEKEVCTYSSDVNKLKQKNDLVKNIGHSESDCSSKADVSCITGHQKLQHPFTGSFVESGTDMFNKLKAREKIIDLQIAIFDRMLAGDSSENTSMFKKMVIPKGPAKSKEDKSSSVLSPFAIPFSPVTNGHEDYSNIFADGQQTVHRQRAVFNKDEPAKLKCEMLAHLPSLHSVKREYSSSSKLQAKDKHLANQQIAKFDVKGVLDEHKILAPIASIYPVRTVDDEYLKMLAKRERIVDQQIDMFDKMVITIKSGKRKPKSGISTSLPQFQVPCTARRDSSDDHLKYSANSDQVTAFDKVPMSAAKPTIDKVKAPLFPLCSPCPKINHRFCSGDCLDSYYVGSTLSEACDYIPPPQPLKKNG